MRVASARRRGAVDRFVRYPSGLRSRLITAKRLVGVHRQPPLAPAVAERAVELVAAGLQRRRPQHPRRPGGDGQPHLALARLSRVVEAPDGHRRGPNAERFASRSTLTWLVLLPGLKNATSYTPPDPTTVSCIEVTNPSGVRT